MVEVDRLVDHDQQHGRRHQALDRQVDGGRDRQTRSNAAHRVLARAADGVVRVSNGRGGSHCALVRGLVAGPW